MFIQFNYFTIFFHINFDSIFLEFILQKLHLNYSEEVTSLVFQLGLEHYLGVLIQNLFAYSAVDWPWTKAKDAKNK